MPALVISALLTCAGALLIGQAACWLCGARAWTDLACPVGLGVLFLVSVTAIHVQGHASTIAALLLVAVLASLGLLVCKAQLRPRATDLLTAAPTFLLMLLPFLANGRAGTLGVSIDNDMSMHLLYAEAIRSPAVARLYPLSATYPLGPHALAAVLAQGTGIRLDYVFAGVTMAIPVLLAWTTLATLRRVGWLGKAFVATMSATTFMYASYYVEGSFKELTQALFVLGFALGLEQLFPGELRRPLRWVPLAVIVGGSLSVYSVEGLPWLVAIFALWLVLLGARRLLRGVSLSTAIAWLRAALVPAVLGVGVLLVLIVPQIPRLLRFQESTSTAGGTTIPASEVGNLVGPVSFWKVFGMWDEPDFRLSANDPLLVGMFVALGLVVTLAGAVWWLRQGGLAVPLAAAVALAVWLYCNHYASPYVTSKALAILSPLVMLLATRWLVQRGSGESWFSLMGAARVGLIGLLGWAVLGTSVEVLRYAFVGPTNHLVELRSLRSSVGTQPTLFLGNDDFVRWELAGANVTPAVAIGVPLVPQRPQKDFTFGDPLEFDSVTSATLDEFDWVITTRDADAAAPPAQMHLVRETRNYELWHRVGEVEPREILDEGLQPAARLDCKTAAGRAILRGGGVAAVRSAPLVEVPAPAILPGASAAVSLQLMPGVWSLESTYVSPLPIQVRAPGLRTTLVANLDRPGPRWPIGRIVVSHGGPVTIVFHAIGNWLTSPDHVANLSAVIATREGSEHVVPLRSACGKLVAWYRNAR